MTEKGKRLFCFGLGYSASKLALSLIAEGWSVAGTCRSDQRCDELSALGIDAEIFDGSAILPNLDMHLSSASHVLSSIPPPRKSSIEVDIDPVIDFYGKALVANQNIQWVGYLSTTGVYGDARGGTVDEGSPINPSSERSCMRAAAEAGWLSMNAHVFRLAGIYGPGRNVLDKARDGKARRIDKPGHKFSRIHVDDIVATVRASMNQPNPGAVYNVCDDEPASPAVVSEFAYYLLGMEPPRIIAFQDAAKKMSPMGLSFWQDNRLVDNRRIKEELGVKLSYPDFRKGLKAIFDGRG